MVRIARKAGLAAVGAALAVGVVVGLDPGTADAAPAPDVHSEGINPGGMYGNPAAAAPYWQRQSLDDCALMAAADVIGELTRHEPSEREIIAVAQQLPSQAHRGPVYTLPTDLRDPNGTGHGTDPADLPVLLAHYGITAELTAGDADPTGGTPMEQREHYLAGGHKVIVGVNAELIWGEPVETKDRQGDPVSDHAVAVIGVDAAHGKVHLNDSGIEHGQDETVDIDLFARSWATSGDQMVVTGDVS